MNFATAFLEAGATIATNFGTVLLNAVNAIGSLIYTVGSSGQIELTIVGVGLAMALGIGAVYLIFRMVRGLIKQNDRG